MMAPWMHDIVMILYATILVIIVIFGILLLFMYNKHKKLMENISEYEIDVNASINEEIPKILELYVQSIFDDYRAKFIEPLSIDYISPDKEKEIITDVSKLCADRLSPALVHKVSLFWNPAEIGAVIADKIYLIVVAYVAKFNTTKSTKYDIGKPNE